MHSAIVTVVGALLLGLCLAGRPTGPAGVLTGIQTNKAGSRASLVTIDTKDGGMVQTFPLPFPRVRPSCTVDQARKLLVLNLHDNTTATASTLYFIDPRAGKIVSKLTTTVDLQSMHFDSRAQQIYGVGYTITKPYGAPSLFAVDAKTGVARQLGQYTKQETEYFYESAYDSKRDLFYTVYNLESDTYLMALNTTKGNTDKIHSPRVADKTIFGLYYDRISDSLKGIMQKSTGSGKWQLATITPKGVVSNVIALPYDNAWSFAPMGFANRNRHIYGKFRDAQNDREQLATIRVDTGQVVRQFDLNKGLFTTCFVPNARRNRPPVN